MDGLRESLQAMIADRGIEALELEPWLKYAALVDEVNLQTNLISAESPAEMADILFADALELLKQKWFTGPVRVIDIGSGVGSPPIPLALALPNICVTMVEARRRRVAFLRRVIGELQLQTRVEVLEETISEARAQALGAPFDFAMSRATWPVEQWLTIGAQLAKDVIAFATDQVPKHHPTLALLNEVDYTWHAHNTPRKLLRFRVQ